MSCRWLRDVRAPPVVPTQESAVSDSRRDCLAYASECVRLAGLAHDLQFEKNF